MAQLNITLNQEEIQALLLDDQGEAFKHILQTSLNKILQAESAEQIKAAPYERSQERTSRRNGSRERELNTRIGKITLRVPRHRDVPFKTLVFENYSRSEAALVASMAEMVVNGVSTRKVSNVAWQRCQFHFSRNITDKAPKKYQAGLGTELHELFNCETIAEARKLRDRILEDYRDVAESAVACLDEGFESAMTVMLLPAGLRRFYRTSNQIERLNKELKRRSKVIGVFPNEDSILRLMGSVLIEQHDALLAGRAVFSKETLTSLMNSDVPAKLSVIAEEQRQLRVA